MLCSKNVNINPYVYAINYYNIVASRQQPYIKLQYNKKSLRLIKLFYNIGAIQNYLILKPKNNNNKTYIAFNATHYKNIPYFKSAQVISRPSKDYVITYRTLNILKHQLKQSIMILSTPKGLMTHTKALKHRFGGIIICILL
uniref:Ribosomal protein S8 n=1 Tax=Strombidium sp. TaxID=181122 RepID=A0A7T0M4J6_9SPIT|nr:ribosomal protein S8 [Strombidium sp.]